MLRSRWQSDTTKGSLCTSTSPFELSTFSMRPFLCRLNQLFFSFFKHTSPSRLTAQTLMRFYAELLTARSSWLCLLDQSCMQVIQQLLSSTTTRVKRYWCKWLRSRTVLSVTSNSSSMQYEEERLSVPYRFPHILSRTQVFSVPLLHFILATLKRRWQVGSHNFTPAARARLS